MFVFFTTEDWQ